MAKLYVNANNKKGVISPEIQGHFSEHLGRCIYEGLYVGEDSKIPNKNGMRKDVVEALKAIHIPVLRWPGGCFADEYHWKDGIGPKESRKKMINTHWGGVVEDNSFGTHEFMELCEQIGAKTYINGNVGSGTVQEMSEWVEYMTFNGVSPMADLRAKNGHPDPWKVDFFGVGNENWGCGGNMRPTYYADLYRQYQTYLRNHSMQKICCGSNGDDYNWTSKVLEVTHDHTPPMAHGFMHGLSLHYYTITGGWDKKGSATDFSTDQWFETLKSTLYMDTLIKRHGAIMDQYDPQKKIGMVIDEWGTWFNVEPGTNPGFLFQQNTMRDALVAGINLNIFNKNCDRVKMANIAQMINVLQAVILTDGDKMLLTPTYHVFDMYQCHQGAELLDSVLLDTATIGTEAHPVPNMQESVSLGKDGLLHITMNNLSLTDAYPVSAVLEGVTPKTVTGTILTGAMADHNTFDAPNKVRKQDFTECAVKDSTLDFTIPPCSVLHLAVEV